MEQIEEVKEEKRQSFTIVDDVARSVCIVCAEMLEVPFTDDMSAQMELKMNIHLMAAHALNLNPEFRNKTCDERADYITQCTSNEKLDIDIQTLFGITANDDLTDFFIPWTPDCNMKSPGSVSTDAVETRPEIIPLHTRMLNCPACKCEFHSVDNLTVKLHLTRHYFKEIFKTLPRPKISNCHKCSLEFKNVFTLIVHLSVVHGVVDNILATQQEDLDLGEEAAKRTDGAAMNRYTRPVHGNRYMATCLLCGDSNIRLASEDNLNTASGEQKEQVILNGFGNHLLQKHLQEFFVVSATKLCAYCQGEFTTQDLYTEHLVQHHGIEILAVLKQIVFSPKESDANISFANFFVGFKNEKYLDSCHIDVEKLISEANFTHEDVHAPQSNKRKGDPIENTKLKKIKVCEDLRTGYDTSIICDICKIHISPKKEAEHVIQHIEDTLLASLENTNLICVNCDRHFTDRKSLALHLGIEHNHAVSHYKKLPRHSLPYKRNDFFKRLTLTVVNTCELCNQTINKDKKKTLINDYLQHMLQEHAAKFPQLRSKTCEVCNLKLDCTDYEIMLHVFSEHREQITQVIDTEFKSAGKKNCEICPDYSFDTPALKRIHLAKFHFQSEVMATFASTTDSKVCTVPGCTFETKVQAAAVAHNATAHKHVDSLLARQLLTSSGNGGRVSSFNAVMCCVCSEPVRQANVRNHLLSHVFTLVMVPWLTSDKCPFDNCKVQGGTDLIYGESLHHIGEAHLLKSIEFLNNDLVRSMTGSGLDLLELQLTIQSLLKSQVCIYCFEPLGVDAAVHMQNHLVQIVESSTDENMDCCELCDGFPCFDSVAELRAHLVKEHFRLKTELASLTMNNIEEKRRLAVGNSNKEKPISNKGWDFTR